MPGIPGPPLTPEQQWWQDHNRLPAGATGSGIMVNIPPYPGAAPEPTPAADVPAAAAASAAPAAVAPTSRPDAASGGGGAEAPAMAGLSQVAQGEGFREGFMREGWGDQGAPSLTMPGSRNLPASSRALAQVASAKGRVY